MGANHWQVDPKARYMNSQGRLCPVNRVDRRWIRSTILPLSIKVTSSATSLADPLHVHAGSDGYGDLLERVPEKVLENTSGYAADFHGVVISASEIDGLDDN